MAKINRQLYFFIQKIKIMKILIITPHFWPENFYINYVAKMLSESGNDVTILTGKPNYPHGNIFKGYGKFSVTNEKIDSIDIYRTPIFPRGQNSKTKLILNYISFVLSTSFLAPWLFRKKSFDVLFVYGVSPILSALPAIFYSFIKKAKLCLWIQDLWPESVICSGYIKNRFFLFLVKQVVVFIYKSSDLILIQSRSFRSRVKKLSPKSKILYFPNSVDKIFLNKKIIFQDPPFKFKKNHFNVVFAGNIGKVQSISTIIEAARILQKYRNIKLLVVGDGSDKNFLAEMILKYKLNNISYMGAYPLDKMPSIFNNASALLISLTDHEIFKLTVPNKLQAYLASSKPIIGSVSGEAARIINESKSGIAVKPCDANLLANSILKLSKLKKIDLYTMGNNGRKYFQNNFDSSKLNKKLINILNGLVRN